MREMFKNQPDLGSVDVSSFNTDQVTNMNNMFEDLGANLNTSAVINGIEKFQTSGVNTMAEMFKDANVKSLDIKGFNTTGTNQTDMFAFTGQKSALQNVDLGSETVLKPESQVEKVANPWYSNSGDNKIVSADLGDDSAHPGNWYAEKSEVPVTDVTDTVTFKDGDNVVKTIKVTGKPGEKTTVKAPGGYHYADGVTGEVTFGETDGNVTFNVVKDQAPTPPTPTTPDHGQDGVVKHSKVYAVHAINLYKKSNLTGKIYHYKKVKRLNRPRFYVKKIAFTKHGTPRYYVKQLNVKRYGWITGNMKFVQNNYYQPRKKGVHFKILKPSGLYEYKTLTLKGRRQHLRYHQVVWAQRVKKNGLQTRFQLKNGNYVSARKNYVIYK